MDYSANRSASVTFAAVVAILSSLFLLLCFTFGFFAFLLVKLPGTTSEVPPFVRNTILATQGFMMCLSLFGIATGVGLIYLRNWARISILIGGGMLVFSGGAPESLFLSDPPSPWAVVVAIAADPYLFLNKAHCCLVDSSSASRIPV